jgi:ABC-type multidrug transport system permease subunit
MREALAISNQYFQRILRKRLLLVFLLAIPFTLLLAEFAAFGRTGGNSQLASVPIRFQPQVRSEVANRFAHCLEDQPGHPLRISETEGDLLTLSPSQPLSASLNAGADPTRSLLERSVAEICASEQTLALSLLSIKRETAPAAASIAKTGFIATFFPGLALFGALFISQSMAALIWRDQEQSVQRRLLTLPIAPSVLVFGPLFFLACGTTATLAVIMAVCALAANPGTLASPVFWAVVLGFGLCAAGLQLAIGLLFRTQRAAQAMSASVNVMLAFFGGGFVPLSAYPPFLRAAAYALPNGAAQAGMSGVLLGLGSLHEFSLRVGTVWLWATLLVVTAIILQQRRMRTH